MRNGRQSINPNIGFFEEQLYDAQRGLFSARSVKEVRFLQNRINFLKQQLKINKRG